MARLTAPNGVEVTVDDDAVETLKRSGFKEPEAKKAPAKKAASSKSSK